MDMPQVSAAVCMSPSWVQNEVRSKRFPQPLRFGNRCTRWKSSDIRAWLIERAEHAVSDSEASDALIAQATKASRAAQEKRLKGGAQ